MTKDDTTRQQNQPRKQKPPRNQEKETGFGNKKTEGPDRPST